jgi:hypothetical protein
MQNHDNWTRFSNGLVSSCFIVASVPGKIRGDRIQGKCIWYSYTRLRCASFDVDQPHGTHPARNKEIVKGDVTARLHTCTSDLRALTRH